MKVGVICDGDAEVEVLNALLPRVQMPNVQFLRALYADMQPSAPVMQVARTAKSRLDFCVARSVDRSIVIIDRETSSECPGDRASAIRGAILQMGYNNVDVVVKDRKLENWLIADAEGVNSLTGFDIPVRLVRRIAAAGADSLVDAERELSKAASRGYSKRRDAIQIARAISLDALSIRSRSFRRFLRVAGDQRYALQSRHPHCAHC